ncbi:MAG: WD40-repeat-containing domain protein [Benjaminiella poitrasii]|nr:MAG: WD40-repeat-containing domain protein [Benjaminiella poitrasii]
MSTEQEQVQVRFTTQQPKYAVSDAAILLPSNIQKEGLSELINNLLENEILVPFDFLIDGQLLRTSIAEYLNQAKLSTENLVNIEYVESMLPPVPLTAYQHDDWISSVQGHNGLFLTGAYDNMVRLWNSSGECVSTLLGHTDAVKSVAFGKFEEDRVNVYSGGLDHAVLAWSCSLQDLSSHSVLYECKGHKGPIESIAVDKQSRYLASASADSFVKVWTTEEPTEDEPLERTLVNKKRKKIEKADGRKIKTSAVTLEGHVGGVNAVSFDKTDSNILYTGGWDHSIRSWDIEQQVNLVTKVCVTYALHNDRYI